MTVTELYRHYDVDGRLLYVGISLSAAGRAMAHRTNAEWAAKTARIDIERLPFRWLAVEAEKTAILTERPLFNVVHNGPHKPAAKRVQPAPVARVVASATVAHVGHSARTAGRPLASERHLTLTATQPWRAAGMSRSTWYRRQSGASA